jgi:uncharacterized protein (DUF1501 family)
LIIRRGISRGFKDNFMKRRKFLQTTGTAISLPVLLNGMSISALPKSALFRSMNEENDRVLVLIQLNGGNDGLNMVIPLDQYDALANVRGNIILPQNSIIPVVDTVGFHPALTGLKSIYDNGKLGVIQSAGYPDQNRSHFRSTDIWTSGSPANEFWNTGWLGRYLDNRHEDFPEAYPNGEHPDPFAVTMGSIVSETCQGSAANFSITLNDPFSLTPLTEGAPGELPDTPYGEELAFLRIAISQTNAYSERITSAAENGANIVAYPEDNGLAQQLKNVALLISGGLQTKVYIVSIGGFDTHANQVQEGDPTAGEHAELLRRLSEAIALFQQDIDQLGLGRRVVGMTFSEFGRRIRSNGSFGTDHGTAAPLIVFGECVNPHILGDNPEVTDQVDIQEGVPMQHDFRDIYGSVLMDWFEVEEAEVRSILHEEFLYLPVLQPCTPTTSVLQQEYFDPIETWCFPNPFGRQTTIHFKCRNERVRLSIFDARGSEVQVLIDRRLNEGEHQMQFNARALPAGNYYYRLQLEGRQKTIRMVKG